MVESPLLSIQNLSAGYGKKTIINNINLDIYPGELCALLGLNGSGKTTLLKALCGLLPVTSGSILSAKEDITHFNEKKRAGYISYIPQRFSKLIGVTVLEVVLMGYNPKLGIFEAPTSADKDLAKESLAKMNILHLKDEDFSKLSEGQKQKVILARTLVQNAQIMLMDEPDSALDFVGKHNILTTIKNLIHADNKAGLITLHDPNLALAHSDRLILIHEGRIKSEINLKTANQDEIEKKLSELYENIALTTVNKQHTVYLK